MYDIKEIVKLAKEVGFDVEESPSNNESGFYSENENGEIEKWDVLSAFNLNNRKKQNEEYQNNYFNKCSYTKTANNFSYTSPIYKREDFPSKESKIDSLITEAA
ncbi:hypothetical protein [Staphylococcus nepalensis]|uniref:Uncharacterized protein n=1 Tax=Staphylococcus nepalensis TaxID=214473 RepID=A0A380GP71_9STAP|nr:hypothetical protein [Staphylococcus nepalensis]POA00421.1 hypothetical protein CD130_01755 [Staphylococcus nepalensis]GGB85296.1 hypothetical protein GCM10007203_15640 [Staphylococcus nepalensis]SUM55387.1 Uncharacterised protein [Staphylococcus nepalensis]VDG67360.1 Uncharacterised protein [Lacrimispora indolis]